MIRIRGVNKAFGDNVVFHGLSLDVERGETLTVLGPSGTGKSVLLKLIIGLLKPDAGALEIDGRNVAPLAELELREVRRKVGMLFQGAALFDSLSVAENVAYGLRTAGWPLGRLRARVAECLSWVGLPDAEDLRPADLSGGMRKRVGLARALAPGPEVILYDEPTTGLDPSNTRRINELIVKLQSQLGVTSVVITHDVEAAFAVSNRIGLLADKRVELVVDVETARRAAPPRLQAFVRGEELSS